MRRRGPAPLIIEFVAPQPADREAALRGLAAAFAVLLDLRREWIRRQSEPTTQEKSRTRSETADTAC